MKIYRYSFLLLVALILGCVGDDIVDDYVEPELRFSNLIDTLGVGETLQIEVQFFNNVGQQESIDVMWSSSDNNIALINEEGLLWAREKGEVDIAVSAVYDSQTFTTVQKVVIDEETIEAPTLREGSLRTTSSYALQGDFTLMKSEDGVTLEFAENYETDDVLPGLYIYLTNNPSTINDALSLGEVTIFKGAHKYEVPDVELNDFNYVLYFCKPFNVKVGDGSIQ